MADADYDDHGGPYDGEHPAGWQPGPRLQRWTRIAGAVASVGLVVGLGIWGYRLAVRDVTGVPVVQALEGPMRIAPEDPGGEIADHQGLAVNEVAEAGVAADIPEKLILAPRPVDLAPEDMAGLAALPVPGLADVSAPLAGPGQLDTAGADLALAAAPPMESASPTEVAVDAALAEALGLEPDPLPEAMPEPEEIAPAGAITLSPRPRARPTAAPTTAAAGAPPAAAAALPIANEMDPAQIPVGTRLVQFGAFDTADEARAEWVRLQASFGDLMAEKSLVVQPAESGGRTFVRLRAHGFEDEADARRFCAAFVAQEATCIPVPQR
jgi:hypothetical protein